MQDYEKSLFNVRAKLEGVPWAVNVRYLNLYKSLCNDTICSMVIDVNGKPTWAFSDRHHLSSDGLTFLIQELNSRLENDNNLILGEKNLQGE